jgi:hypothetical protein
MFLCILYSLNSFQTYPNVTIIYNKHFCTSILNINLTNDYKMWKVKTMFVGDYQGCHSIQMSIMTEHVSLEIDVAQYHVKIEST